MITRDRYETVPPAEETVVFNCNVSSDVHGNPPHVPESYTFSWPGYSRNYEKIMTFEHGGRHDWKPVQHFRSEQGSPMGTSLSIFTEKWAGFPHIYHGYAKDVRAGYHLHWSGSELDPYGSPGALNMGLPGFDVVQPDGSFVPPPGNLETLISDSLRRMMPGIKAELSLINSIIELKDFRSYVGLLRNFQGRLKNLPGTIAAWFELAKNAPKATLREVSRKAAGGFLGWKFAIEPLLSDISSIHAALSRTQRRINALVTRAGRRQRRHYTVNWIEFPNVEEQAYNPGNVYWPWLLASTQLYGSRRKVVYKPTTFHAEIEFSYYLTQYQVENARMLGMLDALGVNPNPAIIWNALPWSFVIDWVLGVSRWLDSMKTRNMEPMINIHRYLWSVRRERDIFVTREVQRNYLNLPVLQSAPMPVIHETAYRRDVGIPSWNSFYTSGISQNELILGAALVVSRRRRRNRR